MKSLLVMQRWSEDESLSPSSGRPHLDLLLNTLGFSDMGVMELDPGDPFNPGKIDKDIRLILVQGQQYCCNSSSRRLRRSLLSNLSLSLGLDGEESDRLRVVGARPLLNDEGVPSGFAIKRHGRIIAYFENSIWELQQALTQAIRSILSEEKNYRRIRFNECWLLEGAGKPLDLSHYMEEGESEQCQLKYLPDGDVALLMPSIMGEEFKTRLAGQLGDRLYSKTPQPLEEGLGILLRSHNGTITLAESCTAGLISARLASVPGSSDYLLAGFVTYSKQAKINSLEVSPDTIEEFGQVSPEVARAMAQGALKQGGSTLAVATTGIAGPGGGSPEKPVGSVCFAATSDLGESISYEGFYKGGRERVRYQASQTALHLLRRLLMKVKSRS
ncbi:MAG: CinA family protein [Magnetococcales bacterium]|nr:CinA family protein [Magnetococcales bacterium]